MGPMKQKVKINRASFGVPKIDLTSKRFGRLYVRFQDDPVPRGNKGRWEIIWNCACDCGKINVLVSGNHLRKGYTKSCGCLRREKTVERFRKHGLCRSSEYNSYLMAKKRCVDTSCEDYKNYGGRGIKFLFESFDQFFNEIGFRPEGTTLDRKDNNGNYEPGNIRWATPKQQANNTRRKRIEQFSTKELRRELKRRVSKTNRKTNP